MTTMKELTSEQLAATSRLFSSSVVRELARKGRSPLFARLARQSLLPKKLPEATLVSDLFEAAFRLLRRQGLRHEYIYKTALTHRILLGKHNLRTASLLNEFRVGECKADLAILNGTGTVYEVKSERDSLTRLERQIIAYRSVFARVLVIAGENHVDAVLNTVPIDVGVLRLSNRFHISIVREAIDAPERTSTAAIFDAIRTQEAKLILRELGIHIRDLPNTELHAALRNEFIKLDAREAHEGMVKTLKKTRNLLPLSELIKQMPLSLQTAALSIPLRKIDHERLVGAVNTHLEEALDWAA
jgi:hypothetical protein